MQKTGIIIPCYNEALRLQPEVFIKFALSHTHVELIFINDGSIDQTVDQLKSILNATKQGKIISLQRNSGKGEAIRQGLLYATTNSFSYVGYLDADLSTTLDEFYQLIRMASKNQLDIVLGSRIKKIDNKIERSFIRHIIGRIIATAIDLKYQLGIYDTQCGAKIFKTEIIKKVIQIPFRTTWFFDIEIFLRIQKEYKNINAVEIALNNWQDKKHSKISFLSFPLIIKEMATLIIHYK